MANTIQLTPVARWRATGYSAGPQGADGTPTLAREAYLALLAAPWVADDAEPMLPVHHYNRPAPTGQAYKCVWGYDGSASTQRSAAGAECYTYRIPADALDATNPEGVATIASVTARVAADRYLARGCCLWAELSSSATPSPPAVAIGSGDGVAWLIADNQVAPDGSAIAPNKRQSMQADIALNLADAAAAQYLHIHLYLADYLGVRLAWIEGGAMFEAEGVDVAFSREVAPDDSDAGSAGVALDVGRVTFGSAVTPAYAVQHLPRAAVACNYALTGDPDALGAEIDSSFQARVTDLLAFLESAPALWAQTPMVAAAATVAYAQTGALMVSNTGVGFCALVAHGLTYRRQFRRLRFSSALPGDIPYRLLVYGVADDIAIATSAPDSALRYATPLPWWGEVLSRAFRRGESSTMRVVSNSSLADNTMPAATEAETASVPVQPLVARDVANEIASVEFDRPFVSGELSSVVVALIPNGAPSGTTSQTETVSATATRNVSAAIPVSATREQRGVDLQLDDERDPGGQPALIRLRIDTTLHQALYAIFGNIAYIEPDATSTTFQWTTPVRTSGMRTARITTTLSVPQLDIAFGYLGKRYYYWSTDGYPLPDPVSMQAIVTTRAPDANGRLYLGVTFEAPIAFSCVAYAADGSTLPVRVTIATPSLGVYGGAGTLTAEQYFYAGSTELNTYLVGTESNVSAQVLLDGWAYSFASAADEAATASATQSGTVTFVRGGVAWVADYSQADAPQLTLADKTTGTRIAVGSDTTETATATGTIPAVAKRLAFRGSNGGVLWGDVSLPAAALAGGTYQARSAYNGTAQGVGTVVAAGLAGTVEISEEYASATVAPGLMMLVE